MSMMSMLVLLGLFCGIVYGHGVYVSTTVVFISGSSGLTPYVNWTLTNDWPYLLNITLTLNTSAGVNGTILAVNDTGTPGGTVSVLTPVINGTTVISGDLSWADNYTSPGWSSYVQTFVYPGDLVLSNGEIFDGGSTSTIVLGDAQIAGDVSVLLDGGNAGNIGIIVASGNVTVSGGQLTVTLGVVPPTKPTVYIITVLSGSSVAGSFDTVEVKKPYSGCDGVKHSVLSDGTRLVVTVNVSPRGCGLSKGAKIAIGVCVGGVMLIAVVVGALFYIGSRKGWGWTRWLTRRRGPRSVRGIINHA